MSIVTPNKVKKLPKKAVVADFGCGEARLAQSVHRATVHSFDLVAANAKVIITLYFNGINAKVIITLSFNGIVHQVVACHMAKYTYT